MKQFLLMLVVLANNISVGAVSLKSVNIIILL